MSAKILPGGNGGTHAPGTESAVITAPENNTASDAIRSSIDARFNGRVFITPHEFANEMRMHPSHVRELCRTGQIPAKHIGGRWRIPTSYLYELEG